MYLIRNVFRTKPGMTNELVKKFKQAMPYMKDTGYLNTRLMTDVVAGFWTVIMESEVENLSVFENTAGFTSRPEVKEIMKDYMSLIETGHREIFKIE